MASVLGVVPAVDIAHTLGELFIGLLIATAAYGVTNLQIYLYFRAYPRDPSGHKISVAWLWLLDTTHLVLIIHAMYHYLIQNFNNITGLIAIPWSLKCAITIEVAAIFSVQTLYCVRLYMLNGGRNVVLPFGLGTIVIVALGTCIVISIETFTLKTIFDIHTINWAMYMSFGVAIGIDVVLAILLCFFLSRSRTGFQRLDSTISRLVLYILGTGAATSVFSLAGIITLSTMPMSFTFISINFAMTKLYVNSYMAMLNARQDLGENSWDTQTSQDIALDARPYRAASAVFSREHFVLDIAGPPLRSKSHGSHPQDSSRPQSRILPETALAHSSVNSSRSFPF